MGGIAMKELMNSIEERRRQGNWKEFDVFNTGRKDLHPMPVRWWQTEKGTTSTVAIGLPQISKSAPPKPRKRWIPVSPVKCLSPTTIQISSIPLAL